MHFLEFVQSLSSYNNINNHAVHNRTVRSFRVKKKRRSRNGTLISKTKAMVDLLGELLNDIGVEQV